MHRSRPGRHLAPWVLAIAVALALLGCATGAGNGSPETTPGASPSVATPTDAAAGPPTAQLAAEGGDPVEGQLGTYTWGDAGSDSPWLPGAPIAVGAGEPLTVTLAPESAIESWTAIHVPASADGPAGGVELGSGSGAPAFPAPGAGSWTVDLEVVFAGDQGTAHYAWRLDVE